LSVDGLRPDGSLHWCRSTATRITDPDAFATAFARSIEHPKVREALSMPFDPDRTPDEVIIPIAELLGPKGHEYCTGWKLEPVGGSMKTARAERNDWVVDRAQGRDPDVQEPRAAPVPTFEGGEIVLAITRIESEQRYGVATMFARPGQTQAADGTSTTEQKE
jgi:hypothetical protein